MSYYYYGNDWESPGFKWQLQETAKKRQMQSCEYIIIISSSALCLQLGCCANIALFLFLARAALQSMSFSLPWYHQYNTFTSWLYFFFPINGGLLRSFLIFLSHGSKASKYCFRSAVMLQPYFQSNGLFSASPTFLHYSLYISNVWEINMLCL